MNTNPHISDSVHQSEIFKGLTGEQYEDLIKKGRRIELRSKSILFHQGDLATHHFPVPAFLKKINPVCGSAKTD